MGLIDQSVVHIDWAVRAMHFVFKLWDHHISRTYGAREVTFQSFLLLRFIAILSRFIELLCRFIELLLRYIEIILVIYRIFIAIYRHIIAFYRIIISIYRNIYSDISK